MILRAHFIFLIIASLSTISCARLGDVFQDPEGRVPENEATVQENIKINQVLLEIETIVSKLGHPKSFRTLPVLVLSEHPQMDHHAGICSSPGFGENGYIAVKRTVFDADTHGGRFDYLFAVLLHEIGHCYFNRWHDNTMLHNEKYKVVVRVTDSVGGTQISYDSFPVSVMHEGGENFGVLFAGIPSNFKEYFVAELLGIDRIYSIEDLKRIPGVRIVPKGEQGASN